MAHREPHPAVADVLRHFDHDPSKPVYPQPARDLELLFGELAFYIADNFEGAEVTVSLRKLLDARDSAWRADLVSAVADSPAEHDPWATSTGVRFKTPH